MLVPSLSVFVSSVPSSPRLAARSAGWALVGAFLIFPSWSWAVDTVEPFAKGASDVELYFSGDGFGRPSSETSVGSSFQLGYGLTDRLSAYLSGAASSDTFFRGGDRTLRLGLYGTVIDTRFFDLDLFLDFRLMGTSLGTAGVAQGLETNLDLGDFGLFASVWEVVSGRERNTDSATPGLSDTVIASAAAERVFDAELGIGAYWNIADGHQLLAFFDSSVHHTPETGQRRFEWGTVRLGYNVVVYEGVELINEVSCDIPQGEPVKTGLRVRLLGTILANRSEWSMASFEDVAHHAFAVCMVGDRIQSAEVTHIERLRVIIKNNGRKEYIGVEPGTGEVAVSVAPGAALPSPGALGAGIRALSGDTYEVPREELNRALGSMSDLALQARIVPAFKDGVAIGFKLVSIRLDSFYSKVRIQNGDIIRRINGYDINSPDKALEVYAKLKESNRIEIEIERNGGSVRKIYLVR